MTTKTCDLFSSRETLSEAIEYSTELIGSLPREYQMAALTALWVSINTALIQLEKKAPASNLLASIQPQDKDDPARLQKFTVAELTEEQAQQILRNNFLDMLLLGWQLSRLIPSIGESVTSFVMIATRAYGMSPEAVLAEAHAAYFKKA